MRYLLLIFLFISSAADAGSIIVPKHAPTIGNSRGTLQIVEFFDYRCGYCKKMVPTLEEVIKKHRDVKVVLIELPIFGGASVEMAKSALAVKNLKSYKYFDYHKALMKHRGKFNNDSIKKIAAKLGINGDQIIQEMNKDKYDKYLRDNLKLSETRRVRGTPHIVLDGNDIRGAIDFDDLNKYINRLKSK